MKRHSWFLGLACCTFVLTAALLASCGGGGNSSPAGNTTTLSGAWMLMGASYITADNAGAVTDTGFFDFLGGAYLVSNNTYSMTVYHSAYGDLHIYGKLVTSSTASATGVRGSRSYQADMVKVSDPGACQGTWSGTLTEAISKTTYTIDLTVDANGTITNGSIPGVASAVSGRKLYCESMLAVGFLATGATGSYSSYSQVQISGSGNRTAIIGNYSTLGPDGSIKLVNTSRTGQANNAKIFGPWLLSVPDPGNYYLVTDGTGSITDFTGLRPGGSYNAYADDTFAITLNVVPEALVAGQLTSATAGSLMIENKGAGSLLKVADPGACQGHWTGTLTDLKSLSTATIDLTVNGSGLITGGTLTAEVSSDVTPSVTQLYCESGLAAGALMTSATGTFSYIQIMGSGNGTAIVGNYITDPSQGIAGVIHLVNTAFALPLANSSLDGPWLIRAASDAVYLLTNGTGTITEFSMAGIPAPAGVYSAYADNTLSLALSFGSNPAAFVSGHLASNGTNGSVTITEVGTAITHTTDLIKVADPGACQGTWTGTLTETISKTTYTIDLAVGANGAVIGSIPGVASTISGNHLYCQSGLAAGLLATNATGSYSSYSQVQITGNGNGTAITGSFKTPSNGPSGSINLVNTTHASSVNNALLADMTWLLLGAPHLTLYLRTDGTGTIPEFSAAGIVGAYTAYTDNTVIFTFFTGSNPVAFMTAQLAADGTAVPLASTETGTTSTNVSTLIKVSDPGACQGHWAGTLTDDIDTYPIDLTVDGTGLVSGGTITGKGTINPGTRLYCESGYAAGTMTTTAPSPYKSLFITGGVYGTTISGAYKMDTVSGMEGSVILTKQ